MADEAEETDREGERNTDPRTTGRGAVQFFIVAMAIGIGATLIQMDVLGSRALLKDRRVVVASMVVLASAAILSLCIALLRVLKDRDE